MLEVPTIPKKEKAAITIANQEMQIENLLQRIEDLSRGRDEAVRQRLKFEEQVKSADWNLTMEKQFRKADLDRLDEAQALIARLESQIEGYRMAIKDICS